MIVRKALLLFVILGLVASVSQSLAQPVITAISRAGVNPTNDNSLSWNVTFDQPVTGVTAANFQTTATGTVTGVIDSVTSAPGNQTWIVVVSGVDGDGTLGLNLHNPVGITSANGPLTDTQTGQFYTVDNTKPFVVSITRLDPSPTSANSVDFQITFSEPVYGVTAMNFAPGPLTGTVTNVLPTGDQSVWTATISNISGSGLIGLDLTDISNIADEAGNSLVSDYTSGERYVIDQAGPALVCITRLDASPTSASSVRFMVEFDEPTTNVQVSNFTVNGTGTTGDITSVVSSGNGTTWTLTVDNIQGSGPLTVDLTNPAGITDQFGNPMTGTGTGCEQYQVDRVNPEVVSIALPDDSPTSASTLNFVVTFSEPITSATLSDFLVITNGTATGTITSVSTVGDTTTVTVTSVSGAGSLCLEVATPSTITDLLGNPIINLPVRSACYIVCIEHGQVTNSYPSDGETTVTTADNMQWIPPAPDLTFHVYFDGTIIGTTTATLFAIPKPLLPGQHSYMIDIDGNCTSGTEVFFNVLDPPGLISPIDEFQTCKSPRAFSWSPVDGATSYTLYIDGNPVATTTDTQIMISTEFTPGPHTWFVTAYNEFGSQESEKWQFTVTLTDPVLPSVIETDGTVYSIVEGNRGTIYIGGDFTQVKNANGTWVPRNNLAALSRTTLNATPQDWNVNGIVRTLELEGSTLYLGGDFTRVSGEPRARIAAVAADSSTTAPTTFNPQANDTVRAIEVVGSTVYYAGDFTKIDSFAYNFADPGIDAIRIAKADAITTAIPVAMNLNPNFNVRDLLYDGEHMYIAGAFSQIGGIEMHGLAQSTIETNGQLALDEDFKNKVDIDLYVYTLRKLGNILYMGGSFNKINGIERFNAAALELGDLDTSPTLHPWAPRVNASVETIDSLGSGGVIYLGGTFTMINFERSTYLAGVDPVLGGIATCTFNADRPVYSIISSPKGAAMPTNIFIGGAATGTGADAPPPASP